jgi:hypothetical protein
LASRRRRRKSIGKVIVDVERRVRRVEKRPGAKRLKRNVVTTEKLGFRAVTTKVIQVDAVETENIAPDAVTPIEASFGVNIVSITSPDPEYLKPGTQWIDPGTGESKVYDAEAEVFVDVAAIDAAAREAATAAQSTADGKNKIYRQTAEPTGGTYVEGDLWFDTDDNNKIYRRTSSAWTAVQLGGNGLANINANAITAGTIDASVITVSNINAGNISTGFLAADRIQANTLDVNKLTAGTLRAGTVYAGDISANQINAGTLTGRTVQTSASGNRVEMSNTDEITFYGVNGNNVVGKIAPDAFGTSGLDISGGSSSSNSPVLSLRGDEYSGDASITLLTPSNLGVYIYDTTNIGGDIEDSIGGVIINGGGSTSGAGLRLSSGAGGFELIDWSGSAYGSTIYINNDAMLISSGEITISAEKISLGGDLVLSFGTYQQGSGAPSGTPVGGIGTIVFRYT